ncbi:hypothetical protein UC35_00820 [Ramlibacter tataouinensis]|uniref:DUF2189 domain-containing protein n=1 Tax=Ramlibacter tataouinensis TaxID=94132 RepID=A0A127JZ25_9BURK|nr:hypothetical protein UC35_00820 [Ramlibacter tataouinensis]
MQPPAMPKVRRVPLGAPFHWLRLGARDLKHSLGPSLAVGLAVAAAGWMLMAATWQLAHLAPALLGGFLFVAPFAAIPIYGYARQLERRDSIDPTETRGVWRTNAGSIALFGLMLAVALIFWERVAAIVFAVFYRGEPLQMSNLVSMVWSSGHVPLLVAFAAAGGLMALVVYALSVVTVPLLLDRPVDIITAAITSFQCCLRNPGAALLWALLIAAITWFGLVTFMVGLVVVFPWIAHASWHAYREMVVQEQ